MVSRFALLLAVVFAGGAPAFASQNLAAHPASVILISVDTLRADRLSCYGYGGHSTPHIDEIAKGGTVFAAISSQAPLTLPSHTSMLTSTYPFSNGVEDNGDEVPAHAMTLAVVLKSRGYHTAAFIGGFVLDRRFGLNQGFDFYDSPFDLNRGGGGDIGDIKRPGNEVVNSAIHWMQEKHDGPFFVFVHLYDLHGPYDVPPPYRARFGTGYEGELGYVDAQIGVLWQFLARKGLLNDTLVVFTADHGEGLGEHGESTHGYFIYQSTISVPLIFHWPGQIATRDSKIETRNSIAERRNSKLETPNSPPPNGESNVGNWPARVNAPAGLIDVAPSILEFLGIRPPTQFQGRSLLGWLHGGAPLGENDVYSESLYAHFHFGCTGLRSVRSRQYKYVDAPKPEFYDLKRDPGELHNVYAQQRALALAYHERLLSLVSRFKAENVPAVRVLSPEMLARLNSLGYVATSVARSSPLEAGADPKDRIGAYEEFDKAVQFGAAGDFRESNALLQQILAKFPHLVEPRISLGWNDQNLGNQTEAVIEFQTALTDDPENAMAHFDLGVSYFKVGQAADAAKELEAALAIVPYYTRAENLLATVRLQQGNYRNAEDHFRHILTIDPNDYGANYALGGLAILNRQWDQAYEHLQVAVRVEPGNPAAHNTMGSYYLQRGQLAEAQQEFETALRIDPRSAQSAFNLGLVFMQEHQNEKAATEFRRALSIDPGLDAARKALASLKSSTP